MSFNPNDFQNLNQNRYDKYLEKLNFDTSSINNTVLKAVDNLQTKNSKSFVSIIKNLNKTKL